MKKSFTRVLTAIVAATLMVGSLTACGAKKDEEPSKAPVENNQDTDNNETQGEPTVGQICISTYKEQIKNGKSIEDALNAVAEKIELMGMVEKDFEFVQGFDTTITGYSHVYGLMPMFGGFPFIMYSFETDDVEALKTMLDAHADLRWNICTSADEKFIEVVDGKVVFVMAKKSFDEE